MRNAIEVAAYIRVNDLSMTSVNQLVDVPYGIQCAAVSPIGILFRLQVGLENRFEYQHRRRLRNPIADGRYSQRPLLPVPAWVCILAAQVSVGSFDFSAIASVRPTIASPRTPQCPRSSDRPLPLLRCWLCSERRRTSAHPRGTPCRTVHRNESWAIPSL